RDRITRCMRRNRRPWILGLGSKDTRIGEDDWNIHRRGGRGDAITVLGDNVRADTGSVLHAERYLRVDLCWRHQVQRRFDSIEVDLHSAQLVGQGFRSWRGARGDVAQIGSGDGDEGTGSDFSGILASSQV